MCFTSITTPFFVIIKKIPTGLIPSVSLMSSAGIPASKKLHRDSLDSAWSVAPLELLLCTKYDQHHI